MRKSKNVMSPLFADTEQRRFFDMYANNMNGNKSGDER